MISILLLLLLWPSFLWFGAGSHCLRPWTLSHWQDEQQKVRTITALALAALAEAPFLFFVFLSDICHWLSVFSGIQYRYKACTYKQRVSKTYLHTPWGLKYVNGTGFGLSGASGFLCCKDFVVRCSEVSCVLPVALQDSLFACWLMFCFASGSSLFKSLTFSSATHI